ncbi:hypothetical protein ASJ79_00260 [Mycobacterium sp. NAZ190054]|nr:hypothetical protein [Mycobacterium sp. NAZ190054]KWX69288.1 hypothetical protein ASJ79_00260 [Mycobacterium sp. NAZ190054]
MKAGARWYSAACTTEVLVIRSVDGDHDIRCGGKSMLPEPSAESCPPAPPFDGGSLLGKRYVDAAEQIELLCTKAGAGSLSLADEPLNVKVAKALPSSD